MLISEEFTNETEGYRFGDSPPCEAFTDDIGRLFRFCQKEFGACKSAVYVDTPNGKPKRVGWYFEKRMEYEGARPSWPKAKRFYVRGA